MPDILTAYSSSFVLPKAVLADLEIRAEQEGEAETRSRGCQLGLAPRSQPPSVLIFCTSLSNS